MPAPLNPYVQRRLGAGSLIHNLAAVVPYANVILIQLHSWSDLVLVTWHPHLNPISILEKYD